VDADSPVLESGLMPCPVGGIVVPLNTVLGKEPLHLNGAFPTPLHGERWRQGYPSYPCFLPRLRFPTGTNQDVRFSIRKMQLYAVIESVPMQ
jgi:hypothetical protein